MIIKPATKLMKDYKSISNLAHETQEAIHITNKGEADLVVMSSESYQLREEQFRLRETLFKRLNSNEPRISLEDAKKKLKEKLNG